MGKKGRSKHAGQFPPNRPSSNQMRQTDQLTQAKQSVASNQATRPVKPRIQPEKMSLLAHGHIQAYISEKWRPKEERPKDKLTDAEATSVFQLAHHLRVFGLLSAVGFVSQSNQQGGETSKQRGKVWKTLLGNLMADAPSIQADDIKTDEIFDAAKLMAKVKDLAEQKETQAEYMAMWQKALKLSKHWSFWAKAYQEDKQKKNEQAEDVSDNPVANRTASEAASQSLPG